MSKTLEGIDSQAQRKADGKPRHHILNFEFKTGDTAGAVKLKLDGDGSVHFRSLSVTKRDCKKR